MWCWLGFDGSNSGVSGGKYNTGWSTLGGDGRRDANGQGARARVCVCDSEYMGLCGVGKTLEWFIIVF